MYIFWNDCENEIKTLSLNKLQIKLILKNQIFLNFMSNISVAKLYEMVKETAF